MLPTSSSLCRWSLRAVCTLLMRRSAGALGVAQLCQRGHVAVERGLQPGGHALRARHQVEHHHQHLRMKELTQLLYPLLQHACCIFRPL